MSIRAHKLILENATFGKFGMKEGIKMEEEIEDYLRNSYNLKIKVNFKEFRHYEIEISIDLVLCKINFTYDNRFTFNVNMEILKRHIDNCILEYYKKEINRYE